MFQHKYAEKNILAGKSHEVKNSFWQNAAPSLKEQLRQKMDNLQITNLHLHGHKVVTGETRLTHKVPTKIHLGKRQLGAEHQQPTKYQRRFTWVKNHYRQTINNLPSFQKFNAITKQTICGKHWMLFNAQRDCRSAIVSIE